MDARQEEKGGSLSEPRSVEVKSSISFTARVVRYGVSMKVSSCLRTVKRMVEVRLQMKSACFSSSTVRVHVRSVHVSDLVEVGSRWVAWCLMIV